MTPAIVLADVDGTVGKLVEFTLGKLEYQFDPATLPKPADLKGQHDLFKRNKTPLTIEQLVAAHKLLNSNRFVQYLPVIEGAIDAIKAIKKAGHRVIWCTAPWLSSKTWDYDRRTWLQKNFKTQPTDCILAHQKQLIRGDVFIDDKPKHVLEWRAQNPKGIALLFSQPWNEGATVPEGEKEFTRFTWADTEALLKELNNA